MTQMVLTIGLLLSATGAAPDDASLQRWALVSPGDGDLVRFVDVLTAVLPERTGIQLVERQQVAAALGELERAAALGTATPVPRFRRETGEIDGDEK